jgi:hypothetical protein
MTDDLVKRLRAYEGKGFETTACYNGTRSEAADRIEELEVKLVVAVEAYKQKSELFDFVLRDNEYDEDTVNKYAKDYQTTIAKIKGEQL